MNKQKKNRCYAIESIVCEKASPSDSFMANVNSCILKIIEDFPNGFSYNEFNAKYQGKLNGLVVGVYPETAELLVQGNDGVNAVVQLQKPVEDKFYLSNTSEVSYCISDAKTEQEVKEMAEESGKQDAATEARSKQRFYAIVATEGYTPSGKFVDAINSIYNRLVANFANGFGESEFNAVLNVIADGCDFKAEIKDDCIKVTCPDDDNGATILLSKCDDGKYCVDGISEYFDPKANETSIANEAHIQKILDAARFRWNNGGKERYAAIEAESAMKPNNTGIVIDDNIASGNQLQPYQVIDDDDDNLEDPVKRQMYEIVEDGTPQQSEAVTTDNDIEIIENDENTEDDGDDSDDANEEDYNQNELALEAARIFGMPNSKYANNFAIEHMPVAYKHIWKGLSKPAKEIIAEQGKYVANESDCLSFWQKLNFVAIEQAVLKASANVQGGLEVAPLKSIQEQFLGELPSQKAKIW